MWGSGGKTLCSEKSWVTFKMVHGIKYSKWFFTQSTQVFGDREEDRNHPTR